MDDTDAFQPMIYTIELAMKALRLNQQFINVWHYRCNAAPTNAEVIAVAQSALSYILPRIVACSVSQIIWQSAVAKSVHAPNGYSYEQTFSSANVGALNGEAYPGNSAVCITWTTAQGGQSFRGRTFMGPPQETDGNQDTVLGVHLTRLQVFAAAMSIHTPTTNVRFAVGTRKFGGSTPVTGYRLNNVLDSMRPRLLGRGR